jgi:ABC-2 type transport system permease protein
MKTFLAFVKKEFYHIFRDVRTMMILLGMPVVLMIIFGFAINTDLKDCKIGILDLSKDFATRQITDKLSTSEYFNIVQYATSIEEINSAFEKDDINLAVVFEPNFYQNLMHTKSAKIQIIADATDPNTATNASSYASAIIGSYQQELLNGINMPMQITTEVKFLYNPQMKSSYNFVPGVLGMILMLICCMMTSIAIVREKEMGTMEVLLVSPMKPIYIILSKAVPYFALSCVNLISVLLLSVFVLGVPIAGNLFTLFFISVIFIFVSLLLGMFISTITSSQVAAMLISAIGFMMPVMLLSGMIFPIENMPWPLQYLANIIPAKWYIICMRDIMIKGVGIISVWKEVTVLVIMAVLLMVLSIKNFKNRL